jgi:ubiquinone/menaquinone biosynthesis C-methylase UbiE
MSQLEHFERLAPRYDELRTPDDVTPLHELLVREGRLEGSHVLDIGCGTGALLALLAERFGCEVAGVDPAPGMIDVARRKLPEAELHLARGEDLPFADETFDAALMVLVVHHLGDRSRAFREAQRVLVAGGPLLIVTRDPATVPRDWLASVFPSYVEIAKRRFAPPDILEDELRTASFDAVRRVQLAVPRRFSREEALTKLRGRYASTLDHLTDDEYRAGLGRAERELPDVVAYNLEWLILVAR